VCVCVCVLPCEVSVLQHRLSGWWFPLGCKPYSGVGCGRFAAVADAATGKLFMSQPRQCLHTHTHTCTPTSLQWATSLSGAREQAGVWWEHFSAWTVSSWIFTHTHTHGFPHTHSLIYDHAGGEGRKHGGKERCYVDNLAIGRNACVFVCVCVCVWVYICCQLTLQSCVVRNLNSVAANCSKVSMSSQPALVSCSLSHRCLLTASTTQPPSYIYERKSHYPCALGSLLFHKLLYLWNWSIKSST